MKSWTAPHSAQDRPMEEPHTIPAVPRRNQQSCFICPVLGLFQWFFLFLNKVQQEGVKTVQGAAGPACPQCCCLRSASPSLRDPAPHCGHCCRLRPGALTSARLCSSSLTHSTMQAAFEHKTTCESPVPLQDVVHPTSAGKRQQAGTGEFPAQAVVRFGVNSIFLGHFL